MANEKYFTEFRAQQNFQDFLNRVQRQLSTGDFSQREFNTMPLDQQKLIRSYLGQSGVQPMLQDANGYSAPAQMGQHIPYGQEFTQQPRPKDRLVYGPIQDPVNSAAKTSPYLEPQFEDQSLPPATDAMTYAPQAPAAPQGFWGRFRSGLQNYAANQAARGPFNPPSDRK